MEKVDVKLNIKEKKSYPIFIGEGLLDSVYTIISRYTKANNFLVVTNETVFNLYGEQLKDERAHFEILPDGEIYKNMEVLNRIITKALEIKLERKDCIIALGGGVIGDMAGFAAAVIHRGIDFIQIPTTLLAQVDSSVGGKVAVNHELGKNLIGNFYQPKVVIADTNTLNTLDERQFKTGLSEVLKYAFIEKSCHAKKDYKLLEFLKQNKDKIYEKDSKILSKLIQICCSLKSAVVNKDEKEKGLRAILNFGHTYAHAIENLTKYEKYTHGEAVSIGMKLIFDLSKEIKLVDDKYYNEAISLLNDYSLLTKLSDEFKKEEFYNAIKSDKKVADKKINFVMPKGRKKVQLKSNIDKNDVLKGII